MRLRAESGFTLVEVLIALAISAFVSAIAYASLSQAISGVEATRAVATRTHEINRAWMILSRDMSQFIDRPIMDEFGEREPALLGGPAARYLLSFTRAGWHNSNNLPRSTLQRVSYVLEDEELWRESWPVLDRASNTEPQRVMLLAGVESVDLAFLDTLDNLQEASQDGGLDTRGWAENWTADTSQPGVVLVPPAALQVSIELFDIGELRRLYALPPL
jgi:general secretion pathway protein J